MDPTGIISAGAGLLGGVFNSISQDKANKSQLEFARQQFATQVGMYNQGLEFNKAEAQRARDYNTSMLQYQNAYNSPAQQIQRMKAAGLNPDLMYGNGQLGASSASASASPNASSPGAPSGTSYNPQSTRLGDAIMNALSIERQRAEIDAIKQNTQNAGTENQILQTDAKFREALLSGQVSLQGVQITNGEKAGRFTDEQITNLREQTSMLVVQQEKTKKEMDLLRAQYANVSIDTVNKKIDSFYKSKQYEALIDKLRAEYRLTKVQADMYAQEALSRVRLNLANADSADSQSNSLRVHTWIDKQNFDYSQPYKKVEEQYHNRLLEESWMLEVINGFRAFGDAVGGAVPVLRYLR